MRTSHFLFICLLLGLFARLQGQTTTATADHLVRIEMHLSAFGVESDNFPSIHAELDFSADTSLCVKSFYNPAYPGSTYRLTEAEMDAILALLRLEDLERLQPAYHVDWPDQPRSTTTIYTTTKVFTIEDYGLKGDAPLKDLYRIVYRY